MYPEQVNNNYEGDGVLLYGLQGTSFYKETKENKVVKQYIDKAAVVAEIERLHKEWRWYSSTEAKYRCEVYRELSEFLDTIETKEVDLDESARHYLLHEHISPLNEVLHQADLKVEMQYHKDIENAFKAGFELGLKSKGE